MAATPVYQEMVEEIRQSIENGGLIKGQKIGTELEWTRKTGLSRVSVRRAIDVLVHDGLVERRAGKGLYVLPDRVWQNQIQLVVPGLNQGQSLWTRITEGCRQACCDSRTGMQIYDAVGSLDEDIHLIESLPGSRMDGAIIGVLRHPRFAQAIYKLKSSGMPFVLLDGTLGQLPTCSVMVDHYQGGYQVGEHLIAHGHRRIGFIGHLSPSHSGSLRLAGLRDAIADAGLALDRSLLLDLEVDDPLGDWEPSIDRCTRVLMNCKKPPTAIFYSSDGVAARGYRTLKKLGLRIPDDVSVVGFDNAPICQWLDPPLATVEQPCLDMGQKAVGLLLSMIRESNADNQQILLPAKWIDGESVRQCLISSDLKSKHE